MTRFIEGLWFAALLARLGVATPLKSQRPWSIDNNQIPPPHHRNGSYPDPDDDKDMIDLLNKFAPIIKLSIAEAYYPSSVEYMLPHYNYIEDFKGGTELANHSLLTPSTLDRFPSAGVGRFLSINESHNPQPFLLDDEAEYLFGPAGQEGGMKYDKHGRGVVEEPVYGFWVDQGRGIVDLWYWTFYPFNFGKPVGPFGVLGNHVGDWEHLRMRTIDGAPVSADFTAHTGGRFSAGTSRWEDVETWHGRPVAYAAAGSHGIWPAPGDHVYAEVGRFFKLVDVTDDDGAIWDTQGHVEPARFWFNSEWRRKIWHRGEKSWLNFRGHFGNRGENDCWWHKIVGICQLVDAPPGPNRFFGGPPDCLTAPLANDYSTFNFYLSTPAIRYADEHGIATVQVDQTCTRPKKNGDDDDDDDPDDGEDEGNDEMYDEEKLKIWTIKGLTEYKGAKQHSVTLQACNGVRSAVRAYRISLCLLNGKCLTTSNERRICSYENGKRGYRFGSAVTLDDIDDWRWEF